MAYFNLGHHRRAVTTTSKEAQLWFDRGLVWAYSFNVGEAGKCFERAAQHDPNCAMAFWGIAYATGPNYNKAWKFFDGQDLRLSIERADAALARALELAPQATPVEEALIKAIAARFPPKDDISTTDFSALDRAYADAMRPVYRQFGSDPDIAALFADALMCMTPRGLWDLDTGKPTGDHTIEARKVIESGMEQPQGRHHPALCHLYIHAMEMSPYPELALPAADRLRHLVPDGSHMLHMPTHIDAAVGDYRRSIDSNHEAIVADDKYFASGSASLVPGGSLAYTVYRMHYICAKLYAAMMCGRFTDAMSAAEKLEEVIDAKLLSIQSPPMADSVESFLASKAHVLIRFGRWEEILRLELPTDRALYCATTATVLYARGLAFSALGRIPEAEVARKEFEAARLVVPESRLNSIPCKQVDVLGVASTMLEGELEYRKGNYDIAFASLREAIRREDALPYSDPPPWMQPVRHALGGLLLEQGRVEEAEILFREDLGFAKDFPRRRAKLNNVWGLHGLYECFTRLGKFDEALFIKSAHDIAVATADVPITVSCYCRVSAVGKSHCCN
ncbi:TPR-like protein [Aspergillus homomorphus CBS 101889]|uniref:TPR-like protein n=1 Tax=Aspergillus homomorphus (strain CBS 101889) TaxID=1450537 RepID=A0A395HZR6_ASPHC|nr:TPR-like protein [Aspergillus homomorphus CBS 101889]RAL13290.1 TPR-like protein [Aspergillus homomorphus CBS 101889]